MTAYPSLTFSDSAFGVSRGIAKKFWKSARPSGRNLASPRSKLLETAVGVPVQERLGCHHDSGRLSLRINPAQRGVERSSRPYQSRRYRAP
jgi:hypothetical protein